MRTIISILFLSFIVISCTDSKLNDRQGNATDVLHAEMPNSNNTLNTFPLVEYEQISTFFTFQEYNAEEAMNFYVSLFDNSEVLEVQKHGKDGPGKEGTIMYAKFVLNGSLFACSDSPPIHEWGFTPAVSNFVECTSEEQIQMLYSKLSEGGQVMMPLDNYGWGTKFGFVQDRFGVSWQLNLP